MPPVLSRARLHLHAWFAIAILVMGAFAPSISAALSHARGDISWQVCSANAKGRMSTSPELDMLTQGHCAMCHLQAQDHLGLPPLDREGALLLRADLAFAMPERFYSAPVTAHAWRAAPARAPPLNG